MLRGGKITEYNSYIKMLYKIDDVFRINWTVNRIVYFLISILNSIQKRYKKM